MRCALNGNSKCTSINFINQMTFPITTTTARIDACSSCSERRNRIMKLLGITKASDEPITYARLLDVLGLDDALWCCRAEPDLAPLWRRYAVWCARQVQHLMTDPRSIAALDVAERHAAGQASDEELASACASANAWDSAWASTWKSANASAWDSAWASNSAWACTWKSAWKSARHSAWASASACASAWDSARASASAWDNALDNAWASARAAQTQAAAFRQLVTTGNLPPVEVQEADR